MDVEEIVQRLAQLDVDGWILRFTADGLEEQSIMLENILKSLIKSAKNLEVSNG